jgi:hypothetical protein
MTPPTTPLVTFVSTCSLDREYTDAVVGNARLFSDLVVVSLGTHLHDGRPEDAREQADRLVRDPEEDNKKCAVLAAIYDVPGTAVTDQVASVALHNRARQVGVAAARRALSPATPFWALFLDGDEVPDGAAVAAWWHGESGDRVRAAPRTAHKLANLWLFLHPRLAAEEPEDSVLLVHSDAFSYGREEALQHPRERDGICIWNLASPMGVNDLRVTRNALSSDGRPMFWHYSWVRAGGRDAIKAKCSHWGHAGDRDWPTLIDAAFDDLEAGRWPERDFVHGHRLRLLPAA